MKTILMRTACLATAAAFLTNVSAGADKKNTYVSEDLGISMELPASREDAQVHQVAMFFLPPSDGFAANVNIQKQTFSESIEAYDKLSMSQFKAMNLKVLTHKTDKNELIYEYTGDGQGRTLHWYAKAIKRDAFVYLVTATALDSHWNKQKAELMKSVNSFKVDK